MQHASRRLLRRLLVSLAVVMIGLIGLVGCRWYLRLSLIDKLDQRAQIVSQRNYPEWMWKLLGDRMRGLERIEAVHFGIGCFRSSRALDEQMSIVSQLGVPEVEFVYHDLSAKAGMHLARNPQLVSLEVWSVRLATYDSVPFYAPDALAGEAADIEPLPDYVYLSEPMTEQFLSELMKSKTLERLNISSTQLPANVLSIISNCKSLQELRLEDCDVEGGDAGPFGELPELTSLSLSGSFVTDDILKSLSSCPNLKFLAIRKSQISDEGLRSLQNLKQLKKIRIAISPVTREGIAELQAALPGCEIRETP